MEQYVRDVEFERLTPLRKALKAALINPLGNYLPAGLIKWVLRVGKSELAAANWADPGGWRSMVISYNHHDVRQFADRVLVSAGTIPMALRNRRKLGAAVLAGLLDDVAHDEPLYALCLGAGPGHIITEAMTRTRRKVLATLVDLSSDAFDYGRKLAEKAGLGDRVRFIQGDVSDVAGRLDHTPDVVKMIGICEYLSDEQIVAIVRSISRACRPGCAIVFNSISPRHGTDRFFRRVFGLHMTYRTPEHIQGLMAEGGFGEFQSIREPLGVYHVIVGRESREGPPSSQARKESD